MFTADLLTYSPPLHAVFPHFLRGFKRPDQVDFYAALFTLLAYRKPICSPPNTNILQFSGMGTAYHANATPFLDDPRVLL